MTLEQMNKSLKEFKMYLEMDIPLDDGNAVIEKLGKVIDYFPTVVEISALAEAEVSKAMFNSFTSNKNGGLGDLDKRKVYAYETKRERYVQALAEGLINTAKYTIETLRTIISYRKSELEKL